MICIYCCSRPADSNEDWLPRGFGVIKNITFLTYGLGLAFAGHSLAR